jgi:predicted permease
MTTRLASISIVVGAALADAAGRHSLAYYALVVAVPLVALAALSALGDVLDGTAAEPHDRGMAVLTALTLPCVLLGAAVRAPLLADAPPPAIGVTAVVLCLALFAVQALVAATSAVPRERLRAAFRAK